MTLFSAKGAHNLDVFIVRRYTSESGSGLVDLEYLVGFRFSQENMENLISAPLGPFLMGAQVDTTDVFDANEADRVLHELNCGAPSEVDQTCSVASAKDVDNSFEQPCHGRSQFESNDTRTISKPINNPNTAVVWSEDSALPKPITATSPGDRILCYDNVAQGLTYAKILTVGLGHDSSDLGDVTVGFEDGTSLRLKADHPVAVQRIEDMASAQSPRICLHASELQPARHSLLVSRIVPTLVTSIESNENPTGSIPGKHHVLALTMEQPERFEPLMANADNSGTRGQPIAISSYDRAVNSGINVHTKNTFICFEEKHMNFENRSVCSAPPRCSISEFRTSSKHGSAQGQSVTGMDFNPVASLPDTASLASVEDVGQQLDCTMSDAGSLLSSSPSVDSGGATNIKIGTEDDTRCDLPEGARLTELLSLRASGYATRGSICRSHDTCIPCSFHFTHLRIPDKKPPCKAGYFCEYCHDPSHNDGWRSKFRKSRPPFAIYPTDAGARMSKRRVRTNANETQRVRES
jgi:hypothetical protein